ncbi:MAG: DUF4837 family protein [Candidatus Marinimicrobia bacterium]|nr:DUF4837 family protein [Candidatus Neomarinimicrobiota bacterium]MCF7851422.1 DUF4837 family protein [Candidatus Neomarinimicrobiota bacterium]MCF7904963.1 DUF4837 family protein [Candidatus Neomarinimicrobiota bacterium]
MKSTNPLIIALILLSMLFTVSCDPPMKKAVGYDHVITVVCDDENWEVCEPILNETLGQVYKTPRTENLYTFHRISPGDLSVNITNKNLLIITQLEVSSEVTGHVRSMLPPETIKAIRERKSGYYYTEDAYALDQALVVIIGKSYADLGDRLKANQDQIFNFFERNMYERNTAFVYRSGEQFELAEQYFEQYGFYLRMMHSYVEIENTPGEDMVWLGRDFPYRWLTVSWSTPVDTMEFEVQLENLLRDTYVNRIGNIQINEDYFTSEPIWFDEYSAIRYYGLWESTEDVKGGPYIAYGFYEPVTDRMYLLSGIIHAPDKAKIPYIRQMETIFRTFDTQVFDPDA